MNEITDFLCGALIQYGNYLKVKKNYLGWLCSMVAIVYWIVRGISTGFQSQSFWHMVSFMVAFYGFICWKKEKNVVIKK